LIETGSDLLNGLRGDFVSPPTENPIKKLTHHKIDNCLDIASMFGSGLAGRKLARAGRTTRGGITRRATPKPKTPPAPERKMHRVTPEQARKILDSSAKPSSMRKLSEDEMRRVAGGSAGGRRVLDPEAPMAMGKAVASQRASIGKKLDYLFGRATGEPHSIERSRSMQAELTKIGIHDNLENRAFIEEHLNRVLNDPSSIVRTELRSYTKPGMPLTEYTSTVRESFLMGSGGGVKLETVWNDNHLLTLFVRRAK
jgi:hypothetical protein